MIIRKTKMDELDACMALYDDGRRYMREHGNMNQWINGFPPRDLIDRDINDGISYVVTDDDEALLCVFTFFLGEDPTYKKIFDGKWLNDRPYGVIHRIAVGSHNKGVASFVYSECFSRCGNLRIDTHADNIPMQKSLLKNGFERCGIITIADGSQRVAFQKIC